MFGFIKKYFSTAMMLSCITLNVIPLQCVLMNNQECRIRTKIIDINNNEPSFYPYGIKVNTYSGSCDNINNP